MYSVFVSFSSFSSCFSSFLSGSLTFRGRRSNTFSPRYDLILLLDCSVSSSVSERSVVPAALLFSIFFSVFSCFHCCVLNGLDELLLLRQPPPTSAHDLAQLLSVQFLPVLTLSVLSPGFSVIVPLQLVTCSCVPSEANPTTSGVPVTNNAATNNIVTSCFHRFWLSFTFFIMFSPLSLRSFYVLNCCPQLPLLSNLN